MDVMQRLQWFLQTAHVLETLDLVVHGACLSIPGSSELIMLKQPVSSRGSILLGELVANKIALQFLHRNKTQGGTGIKKAHVFSDSQSAVGQLTKDGRPVLKKQQYKM